MMVTTQRTSKALKLFRGIGYVSLFLGAGAYLIDSSPLGLYAFVAGGALLGISRLLIWWFHD